MKSIIIVPVLFLSLFVLNLSLLAQNSLDEAVFKSSQLVLDQKQETNAGEWVTNTPGNKVVFFWATWCGPCIMEMKAVKEGVESGKLDASQVYFISDEDAPKVNAFIKKQGVENLNIYRINQTIPTLGIKGIPYAVVFNENGKIIATETGYRNKSHTLSFVKNHIK